MWAALSVVLQNVIVWFGGQAVQGFLKKSAALAALTILFTAVNQYVLQPYVWPSFPTEMQQLAWFFGVDIVWPMFAAYVTNRFVLRAWMRSLTA